MPIIQIKICWISAKLQKQRMCRKAAVVQMENGNGEQSDCIKIEIILTDVTNAVRLPSCLVLITLTNRSYKIFIFFHFFLLCSFVFRLLSKNALSTQPNTFDETTPSTHNKEFFLPFSRLTHMKQQVTCFSAN